MTLSSPPTMPDVVTRPGRPATLWADIGGDAAGWASGHRDALRAAVTEHGAVLIRGLGLRDPDQTGSVFAALARTGLMTERESFAPRLRYAEGVYSATAWPANQQMCMHHELSYAAEFPTRMFFACLRPATEGGTTAVADASHVLKALPRELVERFEREGWLLTRTYNDEIGASWPDAFGTGDRAVVEAYCQANGIEYDWLRDGGLRTRQRRPAVIRHPVSGAACWFNQVAFLNEWTLDHEVREFLIEMYGADALPFNTHYGDGEPITADIVTLLNDVYQAHTVREDWEAGDLLLVDNIRVAHSREPYQGDREVLVAMADPIRMSNLPGMEATR
ncbi:MAG: TauD/TfdA family dioxygenase [Pseudonocardia sp.]|nr:TauD/TfdA family dioxygenase [Pseudonocardia sp.]MBO0874231.1 TauD/TfdA family dioxygenase [Pseudonocardia sp.]